MSKWELSRRELMRHLGVGAASLPLLRATAAYAETPKPPKRLIVHLQTEGYRQESFLPPAGPLGALPPSLQPLEPFKDQLIVLGGLGNPMFPGAAKWGHGSYGGVFTAGPVDVNSGNGKEHWEPTVASLDQIVARSMEKTAPQIPRRTLPFAIGTGSSNFPAANRCFWAGAKQPIAPKTDPYQVFAELFGGSQGAGDTKEIATDRARAERRSLLDFVSKDLEKFRARLGNEDRAMIDSHLESIRQLEKKLDVSKRDINACGGVWSGKAGRPLAITTANTPMLWTLQQQLIVAAFKCDVTRVGTTQVGDATGAEIVFDFVPGIARAGNGYRKLRDWHDLGHRPLRDGADDKAKVDRWTMGKLAELLTLLQRTPDGSGTLLDSTTVLWANHMEDGASHGANNLTWLIAGNSQGHFKTGQCLHANHPINAPLLELARAHGADLPHFGAPIPNQELAALRA